MQTSSRLFVFMLMAGFSTSLLAQDITAFSGGRLITGREGEVIEQGVLLIEGERIIAAGSVREISVPATATTVDVSGKTLMPGMINVHGHVADDTLSKLRTYAEYGVTTVLSLGGEDASHVAIRERQKQEGADEARLLLAGPIPSPASVEQATDAIGALAAMDVDWVKIRVQGGNVPEPVYAELIRSAHEAGLPVAAHMYNLDDAKGLLNHRVDMLAHSIRDHQVDAELLSLMQEADACLSPTLMRDVSTYAYAQTPEFFTDPFFLAGASEADIQQLQQPRARRQSEASLETGQADVAMGQENLQQVHAAGLRVAMGTDSGAFVGRFPGYFEHLELELMVEAGLTPHQALVSATGVAADCLGLDELGVLAPGKLADFLVLEENPAEDIRHTRSLDTVFIGGQALDRR